MIIAIAAKENHLKTMVDPHFGRCDWFCLYDTESKAIQFIENHVRYQNEKAGHDAAYVLIEKGIKVAVAGRFGSKVVDIFRNQSIQMIVPEKPISIKDIIKKFK